MSVVDVVESSAPGPELSEPGPAFADGADVTVVAAGRAAGAGPWAVVVDCFGVSVVEVVDVVDVVEVVEIVEVVDVVDVRDAAAATAVGGRPSQTAPLSWSP